MPLFRLKGIHVPHRKNTAAMPAVRMPVPKSVTIPMSMHIGAPATVFVKPGDEVCVGDLIAQPTGFVSAPVHASISGKVKSIGDILLSNGNTVPAVTIESDGEMRVSEKVTPPDVHDFDSFISCVKTSGVVGLGGAGFPTFVKLSVKDLDRIEAVVINGAECEPYITSDTRTMIDRSEAIRYGIELLEKYLRVSNIIIGIENNKPECIREMTRVNAADPAVRVCSLPALYPQGGEKVLIYHTTGRVVPEGKLPLDAGAVVLNCTTLAFIADYVRTGMPLVEKCITVDGSAVKEPKNIIAPVGTSLRDIFEFAGGFREEPKKILYGGPMMGIAVPNTDDPIVKNTNAVLAFAAGDATLHETTQCIRCGTCIAHCPLRLNPAALSRAIEAGRVEKLEELKINICMECGCCSYVCPAGQPLVQRNKLGKNMLRTYKAEQAAKEKKELERQEAAKAAQTEKDNSGTKPAGKEAE